MKDYDCNLRNTCLGRLHGFQGGVLGQLISPEINTGPPK